MTTPQHKTNPFIPRPQKKERPVVEELTYIPEEHVDTRPHLTKKTQYVKVPHYNDFYDSMGTKQGWRYVSDASASGTVTTTAGSAVLSAVALAVPAGQAIDFKLKQWPGAVQVYLVVRYFSVGPSTATFTTQGEITTSFIDQFGNSLPLGVIPNNNFWQNTDTSVLPTPITDVANTSVGNLSFTLNAGATVGTYAWQMAFSYAYLMPAKKGYSWEVRYYDTSYM